MSDKVYIYNYEQAYFYIAEGVMPIGQPQVHKKTNKIYFTFNWYSVQDAYNKWIRRKYN